MEILWKIDFEANSLNEKHEESAHVNGDSSSTRYNKYTRDLHLKIPPKDRAFFDITQFEELRRSSYLATMSRNETYWNELVEMLEEAFEDNEQLLNYLKIKSAALQSFATALDQILIENTSNKTSRANTESDKNRQGPARKARQELVNLDKVWSKRIFGMTESIDQDVLKSFEKFTHEFVDEVTSMRRRCNNLFHAVRLADLRAQTYYDEIDKCSNKTGKQPPSAAKTRKEILSVGSPLQTCQAVNHEESQVDMWLLDMCYRVAVVRHVQMREESTRQLGRLLLRAKEAEMKRRTAIARVTDVLTEKQVELWSHLPAIANSSLEIIRSRVNEATFPDISSILRERVHAQQQQLQQQLHQSQSSVHLQQLSHHPSSSASCANTSAVGVVGSGTGASGSSSGHHTQSSSVESSHPTHNNLNSHHLSTATSTSSPTPITTNGYSSTSSSTGHRDDRDHHIVDRTDEKDEVAKLSSPLQSPLLTRCGVFLRRDGGTIVASWIPVLLFLTVDRWLHVFDLDAKCERMSEVAAFHTLVSASKKGLELSVSSQAALCEESEFDPKITGYVLRSEGFMVPTHSILLSRCKVVFKPSVNDTTFEVIEAVPNTGVGAMFKATSEKRFVFRGRNQEEMVNWTLQLESLI